MIMRAVDVDNSPQLALGIEDGDDDLAPAVGVAGDVARELVDVGHELRPPLRRSRAAHAAAKRDGLAGHLALERAQDQLLPAGRRRRVVQRFTAELGAGREW
ncbi:hypothetical protein PpBr36_01976 [Pyricularia pennisetigena]|uniref:hypothetical protein n=1 Tax=Pyricularia pennisetigena TaxID=1578925 RepID=UPI00114E99D9|nr:hypothetical protein PpBr36_01976 [Pyricularia pennisetigena]TLS29482.1 hypothetical protein PpBr36_01976 [Pyricularia pennisetigena]